MANYYQMYYGTKRNVINQLCQPLPFSKDGTMKTSFQLEDLDAITCGYASESELILSLCQNPIYQNIFTSFREEHLFLGNRYKIYKGKITVEEPLYGEPFLKVCSEFVQKKKKEGYYDKNILLPVTEKLERICRRLKSLVMSDDSEYFLQTRGMDYMLRHELQAYVRLRQQNSLSFAQVQELADIERGIEWHLRHYKTLRKFIVCERQYEEKCQKNSALEDGQLSFFSVETASTNEYNDFENREIQNKELAYWYQEGGTSAIMEHMDGDVIYNCSREDLIATGVFPPDYQEEGEKKVYEKKK